MFLLLVGILAGSALTVIFPGWREIVETGINKIRGL